MKLPETLNVLDSHGGFTAVTLSPVYVKVVQDSSVTVATDKLNAGERLERYPGDYPDGKLVPHFIRWIKVIRENSNVWRPGGLLKRGSIGTLTETRENSFYQNNNNVTQGFYRVPGYRFRVTIWFDNVTGDRIA